LYRFILFFCFVISLCAENKDFVVVEKNQVVDQDFYASASVIEISGICKGDVYLAGTQILVDGVIEGDLICLSGSLQITGEVQGALRGLCGQSLISGKIGKNITLASAAFTSTPFSQFGSNVFLASSTADVSGIFLKDLYAGSTNIRFSGQDMGNAHFYAGTIRLNSNAEIKGYLEYSSPNPVDIQKGALVGSVIEKKGANRIYSKSMIFNNIMLGSKIAATLMNLFFTIMIGIILIKVWPSSFIRSLNNLKHHLAKSFMQGLAFLILVPLIGLVLLITILGIPIALTLIAFSVLGLYTAKIYSLYYVAERVKHKYFRKFGLVTIYSLLCVVYFAFQLVPYIGTGLTWGFTLTGLGATLYIPKSQKKA
jgi:hypothetical protein